MTTTPLTPNVQIPAPPSSLESEGGRDAIKINLSEAVHTDLNLYVAHTGDTKSDVIANSLKNFLNNDSSWVYRRYFIEPKTRNFNLEDLNTVSQVTQVYLVCTSHPNADYREYICAQIVNSTGTNDEDLITIKPLYYLPQIYGEELTQKSSVILPEIFAPSRQPPVVCTGLRYSVPKKYVWSILSNN